jgi:glycosyltransferase involved in cell wall biosynthesis
MIHAPQLLPKTFSPKVSVIVPAYNIASYLGAALESLRRQSFRDFEVLIVDDGSTDETAAIAQSFCQRDDRFHLLRKSNGGLSSARNYGIRQANSDYIALLDADDVYHPDKLAIHAARLVADPSIGVTYSASRAIRDSGKSTWFTLDGKPVHPDPMLALMCKNFIGHGSNAVFRKDIINAIGDFDETLRSSEDLDFWLRIAATKQWRFERDRRVLCGYRVRPSGLSFNLPQMQVAHERVLQSAYRQSPHRVSAIMPTAYAYMYRMLARTALTTGDRHQAALLIEKAWKADASIFLRDARSLSTLVSVRLFPLANLVIRRSLGTAK